MTGGGRTASQVSLGRSQARVPLLGVETRGAISVFLGGTGMTEATGSAKITGRAETQKRNLCLRSGDSLLFPSLPLILDTNTKNSRGDIGLTLGSTESKLLVGPS